MKLNSKETTENKSTKQSARFGKKVEKTVLSLVVWTMTLTFPVWIYGMTLAIGKGEFRPIVAMLVLISISGFCGWVKIVRPLKTKLSPGKIMLIEDKHS